MSLVATYIRVQAEKGLRPAGANAAVAIAGGMEWTIRMFGKHRIHIDEVIDIHNRVCRATLPDLLKMHERGEVTTEQLAEAALGAGLSNGLITGLEHR